MNDAGVWATLSERNRLRAFGAASLVAFGVSYWVGITGEELRTAAAPFGIVSLELAGTVDVAQRIHASWGESGHQAAQRNLQIDCLYLLAYGIALSLGCAVARQWWMVSSPRLGRLGALLTYGMVVAAVSDAGENAMLWHALHDQSNGLWLALARIFAITKFALLAVGMLYIMTGAFRRIGQRRSMPRS